MWIHLYPKADGPKERCEYFSVQPQRTLFHFCHVSMIYTVRRLFLKGSTRCSNRNITFTSSIASGAKPSKHMGEEVSTEEMPEDVTEEMQEVYNGVRTENPEDLNDSSCTSCLALKGENRKLRNQVKSLQCKLKERRKNLRKTRTQGVYTGKL